MFTFRKILVKNDGFCSGRITSLNAVCGLTIKISSAFIIKTKTEKENRIPSRRCSTSILALQSVLRTLTPFSVAPRRPSLNPWIHIQVAVRTASLNIALASLPSALPSKANVGNAERKGPARAWCWQRWGPPPRPYDEWRANATGIYSTQVRGFRVRNLLLFIREFNT